MRFGCAGQALRLGYGSAKCAFGIVMGGFRTPSAARSNLAKERNWLNLRSVNGLEHNQLRIYTIKPGEMAAWVREWHELIAPLRRRHGFEVVAAWTIDGSDRFVWILRYTGQQSWEQADAGYYASPERAAMEPNPARHISHSEQWLMHPVPDTA
jgi:NIPSNAP